MRDASRSRTAILDAAERLLAIGGWRDATMARIGAEAGVSRGTPGYFFRSKAGLRHALEERLATDAEAALSTGPGEPLDQAVNLVNRQLELVARRPALSRLAVEHWAAPAGGPATPFARLERLAVQSLTAVLDSAPGGPVVDRSALAAHLLTIAWVGGLPRPPAGSVVSDPGRQLGYRTLIHHMLRKSFADNRKAEVEVPDLPASKSPVSWRLPGVG